MPGFVDRNPPEYTFTQKAPLCVILYVAALGCFAQGGWVWNLWGRDCVVVRFKRGGTLRIGTGDAENLARFLRSKVRE